MVSDPIESEPLDTDTGTPEGRANFVTEFVKKMAVAGLGAVFMTEDGLRNLAGQLKLPKELLGVVLSQAERTKDEIGRVLTEEVRRFLQSEKLRQELLRVLEGTTIEINAQVRLRPSQTAPGEALVPEVTVNEVTTQRPKRARDKDKA